MIASSPLSFISSPTIKLEAGCKKMSKTQTTPEGNLDHQEPPPSDDPIGSTTAAVSSPPSPHSHTTTSHLAHTTHQIDHQQTPQLSSSNNSNMQSPTYHHVPEHVTNRANDDIDSTPAVAFPPRSSDVHAPPQNNQLVEYVALEPKQHDGSAGLHVVPVGQIPGRYQPELDEDIDSIPAVAFPPQPRPYNGSVGVHVHGHGALEGYGAPVGQMLARRSMGQQPELDQEDIDSIPAVVFPPQPRVHPGDAQTLKNQVVVNAPPLETNNVLGAGVNDVAVGQVPMMGSLRRQPTQRGQIPLVLVTAVGNPWTSGLFDCLDHPLNAIITTVAPCVTFGQIAEVVDNGSTSCASGAMLYFFLFLVICHWNVGVRYRARLRRGFGLAETPVTDRIAHVIFPLCALCQEFRELRNRGLDPFQGYQGIIAQIQHGPGQQQLVNNPPTGQVMSRS